jgi:hypothetical protein
MSRSFAMLVAQFGSPAEADLATLAEVSLANPEELPVVLNDR